MTMGLEFNVRDPLLAQARTRCKTLSIKFAQTPVPFSREDKKEYSNLLRQLVPNAHKSAYIISPLVCDYGFNIHIGENSFLNANCTLLDVSPITIGKNVMIGPNVDIYTASHGINYLQRRQGFTIGKPVIIHDDVWICGKTVILPGVTIGPRSIIGAGSVVTKDIPADSFVVGNPAVVKKVLEWTTTPSTNSANGASSNQFDIVSLASPTTNPLKSSPPENHNNLTTGPLLDPHQLKAQQEQIIAEQEHSFRTW